MSNPNKRIPKRPVDKYNGITYITTNFDDCEHDQPIVHTRKKGKWVPYVSIIYFIFILLTFYLGMVFGEPH